MANVKIENSSPATKQAIADIATTVLGGMTIAPLVNDLRSVVGTPNQLIQVLGHTSIGDGGAGSFVWDASSTFSDDDGLVIKEATTATGRWMRETGLGVRVSFFGGQTDAEIQSAIDSSKSTSVLLSPDGYTINASVIANSEQQIQGVGKSFRGTILNPTGDFPAISVGVFVNGLKLKIGSFLVTSGSVATSYVISITNTFLSEFNDIWVKNSVNGISVDNSNSLNFNNIMVMETSTGTAVSVGYRATNIKFNGCNFEANTINTGGHAIINGLNGDASASFFGCQMERANLDIVSGEVKWFGGRFSDGSGIILRERAHTCLIEAQLTAGNNITDVGYNTHIKNAVCDNMDTPVHQWPTPLPVVPSDSLPEYGATNEEWLILVSARELTNAAVSNCTIAISDQTSVLETSNIFAFDAIGNSVGQGTKPTYSYVFGVKSANGALNPVITNTDLLAVRGGLNLLPDGTDLSTANWQPSTDVTVTGSVGAWILTPANNSWGLYQAVNAGLCEIGKRYIAIAKFNGEAILHLGNSWNGAAGNRPLYSAGVNDLYGDGDTIAMLSFEYTGQQTRISLGALTTSTVVTARWIMIIEA